MKRTIAIMAVLTLTLGFGADVSAQQLDTVYLTIENNEAPSGAETDGAFVVNVFLSLGGTVNMTGATLGITWDRHYSLSGGPFPATGSDWQFDSVRYQGDFVFDPANPVQWVAAPSFPVNEAFFDSLSVVGFGGTAFGTGIAPASDILMARLYLSLAAVNSWAAGSEVTLDSSFFPPAGDFLVSGPGFSRKPAFLGAKVVTFNDIRIDDGSVLPKSFELAQNYPNPFNPSTKINYTLARKSHVELEIYNVLGQRVKMLVNDARDAGVWQVTWDGDNDQGAQVASGMYFYKLTAGDFIQTRKMLLMK